MNLQIFNKISEQFKVPKIYYRELLCYCSSSPFYFISHKIEKISSKLFVEKNTKGAINTTGTFTDFNWLEIPKRKASNKLHRLQSMQYTRLPDIRSPFAKFAVIKMVIYFHAKIALLLLIIIGIFVCLGWNYYLKNFTIEMKNNFKNYYC